MVEARVSVAWKVDGHVLPVEEVPAQGRYDLRERKVCGQDLDNGFGGWGGEARMTDPAWPFELRLSSPQAKFFQLYSPPHGGIFVAGERMARARHTCAGRRRVDEPGHAAGGNSEIAAVQVEGGEIGLYSPLSRTGAAAGDVGEWLKPAVC